MLPFDRLFALWPKLLTCHCFGDLKWRKVHRACYAELLRLSLDDVAVRKVCYSHDGRWIAAVDYVARLRVWDAATGECRHTLRVTDRPLDMAFSDDDKFLIVSGGRGVRRDPDSTRTVVFPRMECQRWQLDGGKEPTSRPSKSAMPNEATNNAFRLNCELWHIQLVDTLFHWPVISIPLASEKLEMTFKGAQSNVEKLVEHGILEEVTGAQRNRLYIAKEIIAVIS